MTVHCQLCQRRPRRRANSADSLVLAIEAATISYERKALVFIILVLLPIQLILGAAMGYCQQDAETKCT